MIIIRSALPSDWQKIISYTEKGFFYLRPDEEYLENLFTKSHQSFLNPLCQSPESFFFFVAENLESKEILGCSMVKARYGTPDVPHYSFKVDKKTMHSKTLNKSVSLTELNLVKNTTGFSELGSLVLNPEMRHHPEKVGKQLSWARFLYMAMHPHLFMEKVQAELLPPFEEDNTSVFWEAIGAKFTKLTYSTADELSRFNKEFIENLFPAAPICANLLPREAQKSIAAVAPQTIPAREMLKRIGFRYEGHIDPFDGGPHYSAPFQEILPIQNHQKCLPSPSEQNLEQNFLIEIPRSTKEHAWEIGFVRARGYFNNQEKKLSLDKKIFDFFNFSRDEEISFISI